MRKAIFGTLVLSILLIASCSKKNPGKVNAAGSWTFKSVTYTEAECMVSSGGILNATSAGSDSTTLACSFFDSLPRSGGSYRVVPVYPADSSQVVISLSLTSLSAASYYPTGGNGSDQTVTVSVSNGKVTVKGNGIMMMNNYPPFDSSTISFSITQLQ